VKSIRNIATLISCLGLLVSTPLLADESVVFEDAMDTLNNWSKGPALVTSDDTVDHAPYMKMGNNITYAQLPQQLTGDWTLQADVRHTNFSRGLSIGLYDKELKQGYAALWDSSLEKYFDGKGMLVITKVVGKDGGKIAFKSDVKRLGKPITGMQLVNDPKFQRLTLTWEAATGKLTLSANGKVLQTVTDTEFKSFDYVALRGNTHSLLDNVKITTPKK